MIDEEDADRQTPACVGQCTLPCCQYPWGSSQLRGIHGIGGTLTSLKGSKRLCRHQPHVTEGPAELCDSDSCIMLSQRAARHMTIARLARPPEEAHACQPNQTLCDSEAASFVTACLRLSTAGTQTACTMHPAQTRQLHDASPIHNAARRTQTGLMDNVMCAATLGMCTHVMPLNSYPPLQAWTCCHFK